MFRLIQELQPAWVLGENVAGHVTLGLDEVLSDLGNINYETQTFIIPACSVNAPHRRDRVFILAYSNSKRLSGWENARSCEKSWERAKQQLEGLLPPNFRVDLPATGLGRRINGIPNRMDRLKSLGNAVVPQQVYPILKAIAEVMKICG